MKVVFRTDASLEIGAGHVMRCLALANVLVAKGAECEFIVRLHAGNLIQLIRSKGHIVHALPIAQDARTGAPSLYSGSYASETAHSHWLGVTQAQDAGDCIPILRAQRPDWLIVDHYGLDTSWELALLPYCRKLMVIDDLADRPHTCDVLLDQSLGRNVADYHHIVPGKTQLLCGSRYALLRPEFAAMRPFSLKRRALPVMRELLIILGGVDKDNVTAQVMQALRSCPLPSNSRVTVALGSTSPWFDEIHMQAKEMPWPTRVMVGVSDVAQLMADSDLAIGAAGSTSWERCCLGLPSIVLYIAENQRFILSQLNSTGAAATINITNTEFDLELYRLIDKYRKPEELARLSKISATVTDGMGSLRIGNNLYER